MTITDDDRPPHPDDEVALKWLPDSVWQMLESCWIPHPKLRLPIHEVHQVLQGSIIQADNQISKEGE